MKYVNLNEINLHEFTWNYVCLLYREVEMFKENDLDVNAFVTNSSEATSWRKYCYQYSMRQIPWVLAQLKIENQDVHIMPAKENCQTATVSATVDQWC